MSSKVSIIIPCFNQDPFLDETLSSVYNQTYTNWECLIIDDGSTDRSSIIATKWCNRDNRFRLLKKENGGLSSARNHGLKNSSGDYIQFLDGDDLLHEAKLYSSLNNVKIHEEIIITAFNRLEKNKILPPYFPLKEDLFKYEQILLEWDILFSIPIHCGLFKKEILNGFNFDEEVMAGEDWIFWLFLYRKNPITRFVNEELVTYRFHSRSMTHNESYMASKKRLAHLKIYNGLSEEYKTRYFERFSEETLNLRAELTRIQRNKDRKLHRRIKRFFKEHL